MTNPADDGFRLDDQMGPPTEELVGLDLGRHDNVDVNAADLARSDQHAAAMRDVNVDDIVDMLTGDDGPSQD